MPYIAKKDRHQFVAIIENVVAIVLAEEDQFNQLDALAYFIDNLRICFDHSGLVSQEGQFLDVDKKEILLRNVKNVSAIIYRNNDLFAQAGEINYVTSAIIWGILGDSLLAESARYGFRTFVKGILWRVYESINSSLDSRHAWMLKGVFTDIIDEMYRRKTSIYENEKIDLNGDVWPLREISWKEEVPFEIIKNETL